MTCENEVAKAKETIAKRGGFKSFQESDEISMRLLLWSLEDRLDALREVWRSVARAQRNEEWNQREQEPTRGDTISATIRGLELEIRCMKERMERSAA